MKHSHHHKEHIVTTPTHAIRVGVQLHPQHVTYLQYAEAVRHAEDAGADTIFNWDHFFPLYGDPQGNHFEGWTLLTAMATLTTRADIGCLVTCNSYRNAALLADMAKTVDHISNGRLILGLGAGWFERDYTEYGYDFGTPGSRLSALEASLKTIQERWAKDVPRPIRYPIPILIGGGGEKVTLRITAQYANTWHGFGGPDTYKKKIAILNEWCDKVGRNPSEIEHSVSPSGDLTPALLDDYVAAGATHFILGVGYKAENATDPWNYDGQQKLLDWRAAR
jgi:probable F420-dependent oxidoreductase